MKTAAKWVAVLGVMFVLGGSLTACAGGTVAAQAPPSAVAPAPAAGFQAVDVVTGKTYKLSQFAGTSVILNFVNYGCNPATSQIVEKQLLAMKQLQAQRSDFMPVSIFCGCCSPQTIRDFAQKNHITWPMILDTNYVVAGEYADSVNTYGYPTLVFINQAQMVVANSGYLDGTGLAAQLDTMAK